MSEDYKAKYEEALERAKKLYKEAKENDWTSDIKDYETIFPELRESEDERMIEAIIYALNSHCNSINHLSARGYQMEDVKAWLEKRKEQKPVGQGCKGRRGRMGNIPKDIRKKAEAFLAKMEPPYDADDICTAYETGSIEQKPEYASASTIMIPSCWEEKQEEQKQEWSEEDEKIMQTMIKEGDLKPSEIAWLKSLRPSWKPSEDEERLINTSISFLKDFADKGYENAVECIDWLKSLRPQPHWKPSEEQMKALQNAVALTACDKELVKLYNQLKKLMEE